MIQYTKESLINKLKEIKNMGWILNARQGNSGGVGNTLEDLLGIKENNLPIPNAAEWELKCQRKNTKSLITLMHCEPSPRAFNIVPQILLPKYGWKHTSLPNELSFRQTISGNRRSDRGFGIIINYEKERVEVSFDYKAVDIRHEEWLKSVKERVGNLNEIDPQPYWGFNDLLHKFGTKLLNTFYIITDSKKEKGKEYFKYERIFMLKNVTLERLISSIKNGYVYVDFDARTTHNHGTKFRLVQDKREQLYEEVQEID